nr:hypothetical protein [Tanacetum cinerariifolium]
MRPLIIIDAAHLKGRYEGTNLLAVGMDGNNQIIPIATGVSQGETGPSWTWFLLKLKECIGEIPNLTIISDRHATILSSCEAVFPNAFHGYCCRHLMMNCKLKSIKMQPNVYEKLIEAGVERWSRAYCPRDRYNYMTSNSAESVNSLTRDVRKVLITNLMEWYRKLVQGWYCERREKYKDGPLDELSGWAKAKIRKRMQKRLNWVAVGIAVGRVYEVDDRRRIQTVELCNGTCTCRKWQVSGLTCGHVLAICRVIGLTDCHRLAKGWFMRIALKGTYQELQPSGRPKSTKHIRSQGEELVKVRYGRCGERGHNRQGCRETISFIKKGYILEEAHSKQMTTDRNQ